MSTAFERRLADPDSAVRELRTVRDLLRWAASRFTAAGLAYGHGTDNAWDEAVALLLWSLHLPPEPLDPWLDARLPRAERRAAVELFERRIASRLPAAYLTGEAWLRGMSFACDARALVPRSPIAELIESGFGPWLHGREVHRALDLCTGSGCIAIAMGHHNPDWDVTGADIDRDALALAAENKARLHADNVRLVQSDLFAGLAGEVYDLIVTNPPYVTHAETDALPPEYAHEPELGLRAGDDGLDIALRILRDSPAHLSEDSVLICEVGEAERALVELLPELPMAWVEFKVGQMGIFVVERRDLVEHAARIRALADAREPAR